MPADDIDPRFFRFAQGRDLELRNELVVDNRGLAIAFARRYRDRGVPEEDLQQVALEALVRAVDRFDPERGLRFSTFAARTIEGALKQHFRDRTWAVHVPRSTRQFTVTVRAAVDDLSQRLRRSPTPAEVAEELGVGVAEVTLALEAAPAYRPESIDGAGGEAVAPTAGTREFDLVEARLTMPQLLDLLPDEERVVVELRFVHGLSQSEIGARIGVSQMQVSRLLRRALPRLRSAIAPET